MGARTDSKGSISGLGGKTRVRAWDPWGRFRVGWFGVGSRESRRKGAHEWSGVCLCVLRLLRREYWAVCLSGPDGLGNGLGFW